MNKLIYSLSFAIGMTWGFLSPALATHIGDPASIARNLAGRYSYAGADVVITAEACTAAGPLEQLKEFGAEGWFKATIYWNQSSNHPGETTEACWEPYSENSGMIMWGLEGTEILPFDAPLKV